MQFSHHISSNLTDSPASSENTGFSDHWIARFQRLGARQLSNRQRRLHKMLVEWTPTQEWPALPSHSSWDLDLTPWSLPGEDWNRLVEATLQTGLTADCLLKDLYGERNILRNQTIPIERIATDPNYHLELMGIPGNAQPAIVGGAIDFVLTRDQGWRIVDTHFSDFPGLSRVLQNRRLLVQAMPELFASSRVEPVAAFASRLVETLREYGAFVTGAASPFVVVTARGGDATQHFDDGFLARQMGIPLIRPSDLLVRDGKVHLKTVAGLREVDVILRQVSSQSLDPITFGDSRYRGIPGLIHAIRTRRVAVFNMLGSEVADSRTLLRFHSKIIRYFTGNSPVIPTVETLDGSDPDERESIEGTREFLRTERSPMTDEPTELFNLPHSPSTPLNDYVAQARSPLARIPGWDTSQGAMGAFAFGLRTYFLLGSNPVVLPGGLAWKIPVGAHEMPESYTPTRFLKDVWVPLSPHSSPVLPPLETRLDPGNFPLGSRVAENYYWAGRQLERAENTARMLSVLVAMADRESLASTDEESMLYRAAAATVAENLLRTRPSSMRDPLRLATALLVDASENSSVLSSLRNLDNLVSSISEVISPEWQSSVRRIGPLLHKSAGRKRLPQAEISAICEEVFGDAARAFGTAERTLNSDTGLRFFRLGARIEQVISLVNILERTLPQAVSGQARHRFDDTDLVALLRLTGNLNAYQRAYRSRAFIDRVARLLWQSEEAPNAIARGLKSLEEECQEIARVRGSNHCELIEKIQALREHVRALPIDEIFPERAHQIDSGRIHAPSVITDTVKSIEDESAYLREQIEHLHQTVEDLYFNHTPLPLQTTLNLEGSNS